MFRVDVTGVMERFRRHVSVVGKRVGYEYLTQSGYEVAVSEELLSLGMGTLACELCEVSCCYEDDGFVVVDVRGSVRGLEGMVRKWLYLWCVWRWELMLGLKGRDVSARCAELAEGIKRVILGKGSVLSERSYSELS